jgi:hypothetical protein
VTSSTLSGNSASYGSGIFNAGGSSLSLDSTIVAGNSGSADIWGTVLSTSSYNFIGNGSALSGISNGTNHNQIGTSSSPLNPLLGPLQNNGGPTFTMLPLTGSPVIDDGDPALANTLDQRGSNRGDTPNIGAV